MSNLALLRQGETERGPGTAVALSEDPTTMFLHDPLDRRQPYSSALKLFLGVQALKDAEELLSVRWIKAHPIVFHPDGPL